MKTDALTLDIKLAAFEPPKVEEQKSKGWVHIGANNLFYEDLIKAKNNSVTQKSITKTIADLVLGEGFTFDEENIPLKTFMDKVNTQDETGNKVLRKVSRDMANFGGRAYQVVWNQDGTQIAEIYHQKFNTVRPGIMDDEENIPHYWICRDWSNTRKYTPKQIPAFNPTTAKKDKVQLYYAYDESELVEYFPLPIYASALPYMNLEDLLVTYGLNFIKKKKRLSQIVWVKKDMDGKDSERSKFKEDFKKSFNGPSADDTMFIFDDSPEMGVEVIPIPVDENSDGTQAALEAIAVQKICTANRLTSPVIAGLSGGASLGGDGNEISVAFEYFMNMVIRPMQKDILEDFILFLKYRKGAITETPKTTLARVLQRFTAIGKKKGNGAVLEIATTMPIQFKFSETVMENVLTDDELRDEMGYEPLTDPNEDAEGSAPAVGGVEPDANAAAQAALRGSVGGITAIMDLMERVSKGVIDRASALGILQNFYGLSPEQAEATLGTPKSLPVGTEV